MDDNVKKIGKYLQVQRTSYFWDLRSIQMCPGTVLLDGFPFGSFGIYWVKQYQVSFMSLPGIVNTTFRKTELIFTGLEHGKLS